MVTCYTEAQVNAAECKANSELVCVFVVCVNTPVSQVSRAADADETFSDINEYVSLIISAQQPSSLWQSRSAVTKPDVEISDCTRKQDLPTCPIVSLYGTLPWYKDWFPTSHLFFKRTRCHCEISGD